MSPGPGRARRWVPALVMIVTLGLLAGGAYLVWSMLIEAGEPDDNEVAEAADRVERSVPEGTLEAARDAVGDSHARLNEHLGHGGLDRLDLAAFESDVAAPLREELSDLAATVDDPELRTDLDTVVALLALGTEREDPEALRLAHRVLHDLDHFAFNPDRDGRYWGATVTLEGEDNAARRYVGDHGE